MKAGIRKPSIKKSISARTTGKVKRKLKRVANPFYGKKGMGWLKNPKKALSNKIYKKTNKTICSVCYSIDYNIHFSFAIKYLLYDNIFPFDFLFAICNF